MIDYETYMKMKSYHEKDGLNCSQVAAIMGLSYKTVNKWLNEKRYRMRKPSEQ
jgi:transposase